MLSRNHIVILIIGLSIVLKTMMVMIYTDIGGDKIYQTAAAVSLAAGKGFTVEVRDPANLDLRINKPMMLWPPAYAVLLAPMIRAGIQPATATVIADVLNGIFFLLLVYWALTMLHFPFALKMLVMLFKATEINEAVFMSTPSDYLSLNISLLAILCITDYLRSKNKLMLWIFIAANATGPWVRYANLPLVIVLPALLVLVGYLRGDRKIIMAGIISLALALVSAVSLLYFNYSRTGMFFYVLSSTRGFFPENLRYLPPIMLMSFINLNFPLTQLSLRTSLSYAMAMDLFKLINLFLMMSLFYLVVKRISRWKTSHLSGPASDFFLFTGTLSAATLGMLALLSITRSRNFRIDEYWTYIEEQRYLLLVTLSLMIFLLYEFCVRKITHNQLSRMIKGLIIFIMIAETMHGIWVLAKNPVHPADQSAIFYGNPVTDRFIQQKLAEAEGENSELLLIDEDYSVRGYGLLKGIAIIDDPGQFKGMPLSNSKPRKIIFSVRQGHEKLYPFFSLSGIRYCGVNEHYRYYELQVPATRNN